MVKQTSLYSHFMHVAVRDSVDCINIDRNWLCCLRRFHTNLCIELMKVLKAHYFKHNTAVSLTFSLCRLFMAGTTSTVDTPLWEWVYTDRDTEHLNKAWT